MSSNTWQYSRSSPLFHNSDRMDTIYQPKSLYTCTTDRVPYGPYAINKMISTEEEMLAIFIQLHMIISIIKLTSCISVFSYLTLIPKFYFKGPQIVNLGTYVTFVDGSGRLRIFFLWDIVCIEEINVHCLCDSNAYMVVIMVSR